MRIINRVIEYVRGKSASAESIRYIIVGALTTLVNYGLFELLHGLLEIDVTISNVTSISVSIIFAYFTNKYFVFKRHSDSFSALAVEFIKFVGSRLFTMALEVGVVLLIHNVMGHDARIGKILAQVLVVIANYIISKLIVFRGGSKSTEDTKE